MTGLIHRYRDRLPVTDATPVVTLGEGQTPLLPAPRISELTGLDVHLKYEGLNPTGSFKDRGMTMAVSKALEEGATVAVCASTGNTSASAAAYCGRAGIRLAVVLPEGAIARGKLAQAQICGARVVAVQGDFDDALRLVRELVERHPIALLNSINPFRLEGQKTIVLEALEQLGWEPPDWIALPAGNLGNTSAFGKALREAKDLGLIARLPRLAAIQAEGANPFARGFREGFSRVHRVRAETAATAIRIGDPASLDRAIDAIRRTDGVVTDVTDSEILEAKAVIDASGVGCEPASAASVAGVKKLVAEGVMRKGDRVVAVLTGHILKDPGLLLRYHQEMDPPPPRANRPIEIEPTLAAVEDVLGDRP